MIYTYRCPVHGEIDVAKPAAKAGVPHWCPRCLKSRAKEIGARDGFAGLTWQERIGLVFDMPPMRRIYNQQRRAIVRPRGYNLRPGERDPTVPGLSYSDFAHELARGELTEDASPVYTPESRARREAELAAEVERPLSRADLDRGIPEAAHQELHEWARAAYSRLEQERKYA